MKHYCMDKIHVSCETYIYFIGSLVGKPAFLGYLSGVDFIFFISSKILSPYSPSSNFSIFPVSPPSTFIAFCASAISTSYPFDLYDMKLPPIFTRGKQYSESDARFATALDTHISNFSL